MQAMTRRAAVAALLAAASVAGPAPRVAAEDADRGATLFRYCTQCHGEQGEGNALALAPAIAGLPAWYVERQLEHFRSGIRGRHFDDIAGMRMRPMSLTLRKEGDVAAVAAYVASLPPADPEPTLEGDPARGQQLYATCVACHGADGAGNQQMNAPPLTGSHDWYLERQIQNFRQGIRGADPADTFGALMRPMAMTLPDDQAVRDVVAYIMTLPR